VLKFLPPLVIEAHLLDQALRIVEGVLHEEIGKPRLPSSAPSETAA
jgi:hypothetical protein